MRTGGFVKGLTMTKRRTQIGWILALTGGVLLPLAGCPGADLEDVLEDVEIKIFNEVDELQVEDPRAVALPADAGPRGDTVIVNNNVVVVNNIQEDLIVEELPDITLLGFENLSGLDAFFTYAVDGEVQEVFVFDGETLLLDYFCLGEVELLAEDYYDFDGFFVEGFDIFDGLFLNPEDFLCGEALIFTFDASGIFATVEPIDLLE